jgi:hypothetical protein
MIYHCSQLSDEDHGKDCVPEDRLLLIAEPYCGNPIVGTLLWEPYCGNPIVGTHVPFFPRPKPCFRRQDASARVVTGVPRMVGSVVVLGVSVYFRLRPGGNHGYDQYFMIFPQGLE